MEAASHDQRQERLRQLLHELESVRAIEQQVNVKVVRLLAEIDALRRVCVGSAPRATGDAGAVRQGPVCVAR